MGSGQRGGGSFYSTRISVPTATHNGRTARTAKHNQQTEGRKLGERDRQTDTAEASGGQAVQGWAWSTDMATLLFLHTVSGHWLTVRDT